MKPERSRGRRLFALCASLALACAAPARAQVEGQGPRAEKFSEYVNQFTSCNAGAHLDNLAISLQNDPAATGYLRIYGPGGPDDKFGQRAAEATKHYLVAVRGIEESRVRAVYAGRYQSMQELLTELWLVPAGAEPPPPSKYEPDLEFEGEFVELKTWDGPEEGEGWSNSAEVALVGLSDMLRGRAEARAHVIAYQTGESAPGAWRRAAERQVERLGRNGVPAERVKVIFGGYAEEEKVEIWVLPTDARPPVKARRERRPERSALIASLDEFRLKYDEEWAFKGFADVLKADGQLNGCLVVRFAPAEPEEFDPESPVEPADPEGADAPNALDVLRLVEKWKQELKKRGVAEHRLIVMVGPTREHQTGAELETWVVPPGALLPDLSANDAESAEAGEEENPEEF